MAEKIKQDDKAPVAIKYHAGFVSGLELLLWRYREQVEIEAEKWLSTEGIRMDVLILKRDPAIELDFDIGRIFKGHNILEYKMPDDKDAAYQKSVDNIFQVSVSANKESYARLMKEDPGMCEALRDLMKEDFEKTEARGEVRGAIKLYRDELNLMPTEIVKKIMARFDLEKDVAERYVEETLDLQLV